MAESIRAYLLYEPDVDQGAKIDILSEVYSLPEFDAVKGIDEVIEEKETAGLFLVDFEYGSAVLTLDLAPERPPKGLPDLPRITVDLDELYYLPSKITEDRSEATLSNFVEFVAELYDCSVATGTPPVYVVGADPNQVDAFRGEFGWSVATTREGVLNGEVEQAFWLQILSPEMVERLGRERVLEAPATRVKELADGAVLLVASERPYPPEPPMEVGDHLGVEVREYTV